MEKYPEERGKTQGGERGEKGERGEEKARRQRGEEAASPERAAGKRRYAQKRRIERLALYGAAALFIVALAVGLVRYVGSAPRPAVITGSPKPVVECRVNLNTAGIPRLRLLPGIGPVTAKAIIEHRSQHGPFEKLFDLREVSGIGPGKIDAIRPYVTLSDE